MIKQKIHLQLIIGLLLIIGSLVILSQCQKGRGGRSSSSGSRSSFSSSTGYGRGYYGWGSPGMIGGSIFGSICLLFCCCGICLYCCKQGGPGAGFTQNQRNNNTSIMDQNIPIVLEQQFQRLKRIKNSISTNTMSIQQFQNIKTQFTGIFNNPNSNFTYTQSGRITRIQSKSVSVTTQTQFSSKLQFSGNDQFGAWIGKGYILASLNGPYVWWMKDYRDKQAAGQTGQSQILIYESTSYNPGYWTGRWYFEGDQYDPDYSGNWNLQGNSIISPANPFNAMADNI